MARTSTPAHAIDRMCCRCGQVFADERPSVIGTLGVVVLIPCYIALGMIGANYFLQIYGGDSFEGAVGALVSLVFAAVFAVAAIGATLRNVYRRMTGLRCPSCSSRHVARRDPQAAHHSLLTTQRRARRPAPSDAPS